MHFWECIWEVIPALGPRGVYFPIHPSSRQCTDSVSASYQQRDAVQQCNNIMQTLKHLIPIVPLSCGFCSLAGGKMLVCYMILMGILFIILKSEWSWPIQLVSEFPEERKLGGLRAYSIFWIPQFIPDICHGLTDGVCGEKSVMWRNFKFLSMTDVEKSKIHPHVD